VASSTAERDGSFAVTLRHHGRRQRGQRSGRGARQG
jgi:hypothetical protein